MPAPPDSARVLYRAIALMAAPALSAPLILASLPIDTSDGTRRLTHVQNAAATPLLTFDGSKVVALEIRAADGVTRRVERTGPAWGPWSLRASDAAEQDSGWPVDPASVRKALRALADLRPALPPSDTPPSRASAGAPGNAASLQAAPLPRAVRITLEDGSTLGAAFDDRPVNGLVRARLVVAADGQPAALGREAFLEAGALAALFEPGPAGWRDRSAMPGVGVDADRITITGSGQHVALERTPQGWRITAPMPGRAAQQAIAELLQALSACVIESFAPQGTDMERAEEANWREQPGMLRIVVRTRDLAGSQGGADPAFRARDVIVSLEQSAEASPLAGVSIDGGPHWVVSVSWRPPEWLATGRVPDAPTASGAAPADIAEIVITRPTGAPLRLRRGLDGWEWAEDGAGSPADAEAAAREWVDFLCATPANSVQTVLQPSEWAFTPVAAVTLTNAHGETLEVIQLQRAKTSSAPQNSELLVALESTTGAVRMRTFEAFPSALNE